jgi:cyclohexadienyl dehydratase
VRVIVSPGGTNADLDKEHLHNAQIMTYPDNNMIFGQLTSNSADVMITDASEIRWEANQEPQLCGVSVDHPFTFEQKGYLVPRSATDVQQWINEWLNIAQNDGTYAGLSRKYLGAVIGP